MSNPFFYTYAGVESSGNYRYLSSLAFKVHELQSSVPRFVRSGVPFRKSLAVISPFLRAWLSIPRFPRYGNTFREVSRSSKFSEFQIDSAGF
jgi:hypothetical protein